MQRLQIELKRFGLHLLSGLFIILGGLFVYLISIMLVGYLPYSDRPGSGWYKGQIHISWQTISFIGSFILFLGIYLLAALIISYLLLRIISLFGYNRLVFALLGSLIIGFLSFYVTLGIGWYIALDDSTVIAAGILGIVYGATLFPKYLDPNKRGSKKT